MADANIIARFETADELILAVQAARKTGYAQMEAYSPFPVPGLSDALAFRERWIPVVALAASLVGAAGFYLMQWGSAVLNYPFVEGGKPLYSWPAFLLVTFEMGILAAVLTAFVAMLAGNRLPKPYHPAFNWASFDRASGDGFFLLLENTDRATAIAFFEELQAAEIQELES